MYQLQKYEFAFRERIFNCIMISEQDWIIRTQNKVLIFKSDNLVKTIEINNYGEIIDTNWGGNYALVIKHNRFFLIGRKKCYSWSIDDFSFQEHLITNSLETLPAFPNSDLRPFRSSGENKSNEISILLETMVVGDSPFWANLLISEELNISWVNKYQNHLRAKDYPREIWQILNKSYNTPDISDILLKDGRMFIYSTGFHRAYGKYDMDYSIFSEIDKNGKSIGKQISFESSFGFFSSDKKWIIIKPLYKKGETKGKMYLYNIETKKEQLINLPKGTSSFRILDIYNDTIILSNDNIGKYPIYETPEDKNLHIIKINNWRE